MIGYAIKNKKGRYWNNRHREFYKTILSASLYKSEKSAIRNYTYSFECGTANEELNKECFVIPVAISEGVYGE